MTGQAIMNPGGTVEVDIEIKTLPESAIPDRREFRHLFRQEKPIRAKVKMFPQPNQTVQEFRKFPIKERFPPANAHDRRATFLSRR